MECTEKFDFIMMPNNKRKRVEKSEVIMSPEYQKLYHEYWSLMERHVKLTAEYNELIFKQIKEDLKK